MKKASQRDFAVYCTPERQKKGVEIVIEAADRGSSGNVIITRQRELQECALDTLYRKGALGKGDEARWRYNAGFWLRELYLNTHPSEGVGAYSIRLESTGEMTDEMAWNLKAFQETATELMPHWRVLEQLCCENHAQANLAPIIRGLDALRDLRDGYIPDYLAG